MDPIIEIIGTIFTVDTSEYDVSSNLYNQRIIIENAMSVNTVETPPSRVLISVKSISPINFKVNDPITIKGAFHRMPPDQLSYMYNTRAPQGYLRYNGQILR